ncbi:MAG: hypothetical protein K2J60_13800 [Acetatifactor sp.]|nr:hypothetical protein [Acetatifactor sp.]
MNKISLFYKLYRKKLSENAVLFLLFSILAAAVSMVLLVQENNAGLLQNQMKQSGFGFDAEHFSSISRSAENTLGLIAIAAVFIGAIGGLCLIGFRNQSTEKSIVMMYLFGMQKKDLVIKALLDAAVYGFLSSCTGFCFGYPLFLHFSKQILEVEISWTFASLQSMALFSLQSTVVFLETFGLIAFLIFLGNLFIDLKITERSIVRILYGRKGAGEKQNNCRYILAGEILGILLYSLLIFRVKASYLFTAGLVVAFLTAALFIAFHIFFGSFTKKNRKNRKIDKVRDLSFCFLCSRNKRDALLAIVISMGTIFLCLAANIIFNINGVLRSAFQDNLGYSCLVRVDDFGQKDLIRDRLDENGITYTYIYSKMMDYSQLNHMGNEEGRFWALVIDSQTDGNRHFFVPENSFYTEKYFAGRCGTRKGQQYDLFGSPVVCLGSLDDNQYLSFVNYSFIVNMEDWELGIDDSWHAMFLINTSLSREKEIECMLTDLSCHMRTPAEIIEEIKEMLSDYLDILALVAGMIVLVTAAVFYTVIRSDLSQRRKEMYLYRVYGASLAKAQKVIFYEYTMIALVSSMAVSFAVVVCGELYFYLGLQKHFPLSIPITAITTALAVIFIFLCCQTAGFANARSVGLEIIRDE